MGSAATVATPKKLKTFCATLAECGSVTEAALTAGMDRSNAYKLRDRRPEFAAAWDAALERAYDKLEREAYRRAHDGVDEDVYHEGAVCGTKRKYSDTLLMFLLNGRRSTVFKNRTELSGEVATTSRVIEIPSNGR